MNEELNRLYEELEQVRSSPLEYLPRYGFSPKEEIIGLIEEDIQEVRERMELAMSDYTDEELEEERTFLCASQGISRYC